MKYRIKEVEYSDLKESYFFLQVKKGWFDSWVNIGYEKFLTLEAAKAGLAQEIDRAEREERIKNPPVKYHPYNK